RASPHAPRRQAKVAPQGRGRPSGHAQGSHDPRLPRDRAARAAGQSDRPELSDLRRSRRHHRLQRRAVCAGNRHPGDLCPAWRRRGHPRLLPRSRADDGAARAHPRQELPARGGTAVGVPHAPGRPRPRAREAHAPVQTIPRAPQGERRSVSDVVPVVEELVPAPDPVETCARFADLPLLVFLDSGPRTRYEDLAIPDVMLGLEYWVIAWDHQTKRAWVISTGIPEQGAARRDRAARRLAFVKERLADRRSDRLAAPSYPVPDVP